MKCTDATCLTILNEMLCSGGIALPDGMSSQYVLYNTEFTSQYFLIEKIFSGTARRPLKK